MNSHIKLAYQAGVQQALEDAGLVKQASYLGLLTSLVPPVGGGALGATLADEDSVASGALVGTISAPILDNLVTKIWYPKMDQSALETIRKLRANRDLLPPPITAGERLIDRILRHPEAKRQVRLTKGLTRATALAAALGGGLLGGYVSS